MKAEVVGVGTELLLGQIANTNAQRISVSLAQIGIDVHWHSAVGDNLERITDVLLRGIERSDAIVITGGLGPTPDDITAQAVALATGRRLVRDERLANLIRSFFEGRGRDMPEENLKQADLPDGATPIEPEGTAPGFYVEHDGTLLFALPGVPWEMTEMLRKTVVPVLRARAGDAVTVSRHVLTIGLGESHLHRAIADIVDAQTNPTIAFLAGGGIARVRITAKATTEDEAHDLIAPVEAAIRQRLGDRAVEGDAIGVVDALSNVLRKRGLTVAAAESLTGGMLGAALTEADGASDFFYGSIVCYTNDAKQEVAGVPKEIIERHGAVSAATATAMAEGAARAFDADLALATTGVAGPTEQEAKPVGLVYVAASLHGRTEAREVRGYGDRTNIRTIAVNSAADLGRRLIERHAGGR
ncbi:MAG: competence/damage-inducible protein A [Actinomycetota bacterium]